MSNQDEDARFTVGPYFHVGNKLYAIAPRHFIVEEDGVSDKSSINTGRDIIFMAEDTIENYIAAIGTRIAAVEKAKSDTTHRIEYVKSTLVGYTDNKQLMDYMKPLMTRWSTLKAIVGELESFRKELQGKWKDIDHRVFGYEAWSPPFEGGPCKDICILELDKEKFIGLVGNVLSLGAELDAEKLDGLLRDELDPKKKFTPPTDGRVILRDILSMNCLDNVEDITVGSLTQFLSYRRTYFPAGSMTFIQMDQTRQSNGFEITNNHPIQQIWEQVRKKFPGADLTFGDLDTFFADVLPKASTT